MFNLALFEPEIPPNTGNIIRLAANTGAALHLIGPLGFELDDRRLRRAGLDYHEFAELAVHASLDDFLATVPDAAVYPFSSRGRRCFSSVGYAAGDVLLFGAESRGLPGAVLARFDAARVLRLPMRPGVRSLNLANAVAVACFEAWRQLGYAGAAR